MLSTHFSTRRLTEFQRLHIPETRIRRVVGIIEELPNQRRVNGTILERGGGSLWPDVTHGERNNCHG